MAKVERLPVQHRNHPHCPDCGARLPTFDSALIATMDAEPADVLCVIFRVRCKCGSVWDLKKEPLPKDK